jgi:hypothetical protein
MNSQLDGYRGRVVAAQARLRALPQQGAGSPGPPDETTGERWDRGNVLGHMAEMLPFWCEQFRHLRAGGREFGRGEEGYAQRRQGIERGQSPEPVLRAEVDAGIGDLLKLLHELEGEDLNRPVVYRRRDGQEEATLAAMVDQLLVRHLEEHVEQLAALTGNGESSARQ